MEYRLGWNTISEVSRPLCQVIDCPRAPPTSLFHCIPHRPTWLSYTPLYCIVVLLVVLHSHCIVLLDRHWFDDHSITAPPTALPSAQWSSPHSTLVLLERKVLLHITRLFKRKVRSSQFCLEL